MKRMTGDEIDVALRALQRWELRDDSLARTFVFADFLEAMSFVTAAAGLAEEAGHHPDIDIRYNRVTLTLTTHDAGGITQKDFALAAQLDRIQGSAVPIGSANLPQSTVDQA